MYETQKRSRDDILMALKERDDLAEKLKKAEKQLEKLKSAPKPVTVHLSEENFHSSRSTHHF